MLSGIFNENSSVPKDANFVAAKWFRSPL
jgi:hypothetical protein